MRLFTYWGFPLFVISTVRTSGGNWIFKRFIIITSSFFGRKYILYFSLQLRGKVKNFAVNGDGEGDCQTHQALIITKCQLVQFIRDSIKDYSGHPVEATTLEIV